MIGVFCWAVCGSCMLLSCILRTCQLYLKTPFELQPEDGFIKKPKHVADIYIINYWKHNGEASPEIHSRYRLLTGTTVSEHYKDELRIERHSNFTIQTSGCSKILSPNAQEFRLSGLLGDDIVAANWWALELRS